MSHSDTMSNRLDRCGVIEIRSFKWPKRLKSVARTAFLGDDEFGRWLGAARGDPWSTSDGSPGGVFEESLVKLVPAGTFWTACFHPKDPVVDVDIVLPVEWAGNVLEEVDLELDILRSADGTVRVRDEYLFRHLKERRGLPADIVVSAEATCERIRDAVARRAEPFGDVGQSWLTRFVQGLGRLR